MKRVQAYSLRRWFAGVILLLAAFAPHLFASGHFPAAGDTLHASFPNAHLFTGEEFDADLGLYHLRARYHNPDTGRFWTQDGFEGFGSDPASLHKYAYCGKGSVLDNGILIGCSAGTCEQENWPRSGRAGVGRPPGNQNRSHD
jgi:RHS repeat-associated protein